VCKINHSLERETSLLTGKDHLVEGNTINCSLSVVGGATRLIICEEKQDIIARISVVLKNGYVKLTAIINSQSILKCSHAFF